MMDIVPGNFGSYPVQLVLINGFVFFTTALMLTANCGKRMVLREGTTLVKDLYGAQIGYNILELTGANKLAWFIAYTFTTGYQLFRSDGTDAGTYIVKEISYFGFGLRLLLPCNSQNTTINFIFLLTMELAAGYGFQMEQKQVLHMPPASMMFS